MSSNLPKLSQHERILVHQVFEGGELFGFETRNKYRILDEHRNPVAFAAEQRKGILGFILRQYLGHWFKFDVHFFGPNRSLFLVARHPFRWFFTRIELYDTQERLIGAIQKRFSILTKRFDVENAQGAALMEVASPVWRFWSFAFKQQGRTVAAVKKKWTGLLAESFTDKDNFLVEYSDPSMSEDERRLVMAAAVFIDLLYFENKD